MQLSQTLLPVSETLLKVCFGSPDSIPGTNYMLHIMQTPVIHIFPHVIRTYIMLLAQFVSTHKSLVSTVLVVLYLHVLEPHMVTTNAHNNDTK